MSTTLVIIPTYDEAENVRPIVTRTLAATDDLSTGRQALGDVPVVAAPRRV
ncbi:hypothetical protein IAE22_33695, partial [Bacillus sp. S34]|nr:hypothetical protein [Bacillus sp. S34]